MSTLHIRAVGDIRCAYIDARGVPVVGRYAGRDRRTHEPMPDGEEVPDHADIRRALSRGELALVAPKPIAPAPAPATKPATPKGTDQ